MRTIAVLALLSLAACDTSPTAPTNTYLVTAFATPASIKAGTTANLIISITNVSDKAQTFDQNFCGPAYQITPPPGVQLSAQVFACFTDYLIRTLQPGEQAVYAAEWTSVHIDSLGHADHALPAGTYTVRGPALLGGDTTKVHSDPFVLTLTP
jgi:hypothetical protein